MLSIPVGQELVFTGRNGSTIIEYDVQTSSPMTEAERSRRAMQLADAVSRGAGTLSIDGRVVRVVGTPAILVPSASGPVEGKHHDSLRACRQVGLRFPLYPWRFRFFHLYLRSSTASTLLKQTFVASICLNRYFIQVAGKNRSRKNQITLIEMPVFGSEHFLVEEKGTTRKIPRIRPLRV